MSKKSDLGDGDRGEGDGGGVLSKMVKFVKSPTVHWSDLDSVKSDDSEDTQSREALKEMIERKRRNDFVRNREFDMLRKVRYKALLKSEEGLPEPIHPSGSQPAAQGGEHAARTLEKIDEIEAQMSTAWFHRQGDPARPHPHPPPPPRPRPQQPPAPSPRPAGPYRETVVMPVARDAASLPHLTADVPLLDPAVAGVPAFLPTFAPTEPMEYVPPAQLAPEGAAPAYGANAPAEVTLEAKPDPALEEAAIRFANGDSAGAEASLRDLLAEGGERVDDMGTWLTLFDFYRATGNHGQFDDTALHFAARFGRSAPQWGVEAGADSRMIPAMAEAGAGGASTARFHWVCPSTMSIQSLAALNASLTRNAPPWRIDWRYVKNIEPAALQGFCDVLQRWAGQPVRLKFLGVEVLLQFLTDRTPSEDRQTDPLWWKTRLALLRVMGETDEFELVALNYCVTYEVSPPAWEMPRNDYSPMTEAGDTIIPSDEERVTLAPPPGNAAASAPNAPPLIPDDGVARAQLKGELLDSADSALKQVPMGMIFKSFEFDCRNLLRVDFSAAGDLLNWAEERKNEGRAVSFWQVHRLVAAFFGVIGITDAARVMLRVD